MYAWGTTINLLLFFIVDALWYWTIRCFIISNWWPSSSSSSSLSSIVNYIMSNPNDEHFPKNMILLPNANSNSYKNTAVILSQRCFFICFVHCCYLIGYHKSFKSHSSYFHIDEAGKSCFNMSEAHKTIEYLRSIQFIQQVKMMVPTAKFHLPQKRDQSTRNFFCNEDVYGNFNLLMMTGVVKLP